MDKGKALIGSKFPSIAEKTGTIKSRKRYGYGEDDDDQ